MPLPTNWIDENSPLHNSSKDPQINADFVNELCDTVNKLVTSDKEIRDSILSPYQQWLGTTDLNPMNVSIASVQTKGE